MHVAEDLFFLGMDLHGKFSADIFQLLLENVEIYVAFCDIAKHDHGKNVLKQGLIDIKNIYVAFGNDVGNFCSDADLVLADNGNDDPFQLKLLLFFFR